MTSTTVSSSRSTPAQALIAKRHLYKNVPMSCMQLTRLAMVHFCWKSMIPMKYASGPTTRYTYVKETGDYVTNTYMRMILLSMESSKRKMRRFYKKTQTNQRCTTTLQKPYMYIRQHCVTSSFLAKPRSPAFSVSCECATLLDAKDCPSMPPILSLLRRAMPMLLRPPCSAESAPPGVLPAAFEVPWGVLAKPPV